MRKMLRFPALFALIWATVAFTALIGCGSATPAPMPSPESAVPTATPEMAEIEKATTPTMPSPTSVPEIPTPEATMETAHIGSDSAVATRSFEFPPHIAAAVAQMKSEAARLLADTAPANSAAGCGRLCDRDFWGTHNFRTEKYENVPDALDVKSEIARGSNVNASDETGQTPLCMAVLLPNPLLTALLLESGADADNGKCSDGYSPMHWAVQNNDPYAAQLVVALLLERGADVNRNIAGFTPLHVAARWADDIVVVETLLIAGASLETLVEAQGDRVHDFGFVGAQPIHIAAAQNEIPNVTELLIDWGADPNEHSRVPSPLHIASGSNPNPAVIEVLLEKGADAGYETEHGVTPLHSTVSYGIDSRWDRLDRNVVTAKLLLDAGAHINASDMAGETPLHRAVMYADMGLDSEPESVIAFLLERGANPNARNYEGKTALHFALTSWNVGYHTDNIVETLLGHGTDVNATTFDGSTALHIVASEREPSLHLIELLLGNGADANARNNDGETACMIAEGIWFLAYERDEIIALLCQ